MINSSTKNDYLRSIVELQRVFLLYAVVQSSGFGSSSPSHGANEGPALGSGRRSGDHVMAWRGGRWGPGRAFRWAVAAAIGGSRLGGGNGARCAAAAAIGCSTVFGGGNRPVRMRICHELSLSVGGTSPNEQGGKQYLAHLRYLTCPRHQPLLSTFCGSFAGNGRFACA